MALPTFDPSQPFTAVEGETLDTLVPSVRAPVVKPPSVPAFDPSKPFTPAPEAPAANAAPVFDPSKPFTSAPDVYTLDTFNAKTPEELAEDKTFSPVQFGAQYLSSGEGTPEQIEKLRQVYVAKEAAGTTALEKAKATFAGVLPALKTIAGGVEQVAKTANKFSLQGVGEALTRVANGESASDVGAEFVKAAVEVPASVEASVVGTADLLRRTRRVLNENSIRGKFSGGTVAEQGEQQTRQRLFDDIEGLKSAERAGKGNAEVMKAVGLDAETLKEAGIVLDPEAIQNLSVVTDPINYIPLGGVVNAVSKVGGKALRIGLATTGSAEQAAKLAKALNSATEVASKASSSTLGAVAQKAGAAIEGTGNLAAKTFKSVGGVAGGLGLGALLGRDIYSVLGGVAVAKVAPKVAQVTGRAIKAGGEMISGTRAVPAGLLLAGDVAKAGAVGAAKGVVEGGVIAAPFLLGARPEEEANILGMVGLGGAIRAGLEGGRPVAKAAGTATQNKLAESIFRQVEQTEAPESPIYGTEPVLDSAHSAAFIALPDSGKKLVNWGRELLREAGGEVYTLPNDEFVKAAGDSGLGYAIKIGEKIAPDGNATPLVRIFLNASSEALPHEFFHALESLDPASADALKKTVQSEWTKPQKESFERYYNTLRNRGLPESQWRHRLSDEQVAGEAAAEVFSRLFLAQDLTGVSPTVGQKAALFVSSIVDKLGSPLAAVGRTPGEAGVSTLGVRPGVSSTKLGQTWLANLLQRVDETGSLGEAPAPSKTFEGLTVADISDTTPIRTVPEVVPMGRGTTPPPPATPPPTPPPIAPAPTGPVTPAPAAPTGPRNIRTTRATQNDFAGRRAEETGTARAREVAEKLAEPNVIARVQEISDLLESGAPVVEIEHSGAIAAGSARKPSGRTARRLEQESAYIAEGLGAAPESVRATYQKVFVPVRWETVAGKPQLLAMSLDKVIANTHKVASEAAVRGVGDLVPYEISAGKLTEAGWNSFVADLRDYAANQQNGYRGDGQKLLRPVEDIGLSIPAENPAYNPVQLGEAKANFLNVVQGLNPPLTAREGSNLAKAIPGNVKGQILAEVNRRTPERPAVIRAEDITKQDFKSQPGRSIKETNPLRNELAAAGVPMRELIEVTERINAESINKVTPRPDLEFSAPVTDTIRGGFLPAPESGTSVAESVKRIITAAPEDFVAMTKTWDGGLTKEAYRIGLNVKTMAELVELKQAQEQARSRYKREFALGNEQAGINLSVMPQLFREAYEAATDSGSAAGALGWRQSYPEAKAPFAQVGKFLPGVETDKARKAGLLPDAKPARPTPSEPIRAIAGDYAKTAGIDYTPSKNYAEVNPDLAKRLADYYDSAQHSPDDPAVQASYQALADETMAQYNALKDAGYVIEPFTGDGEPYKSSAEAVADARDNKHLFFLKTEGNFSGDQNNPMLQPAGDGLVINDIFRGVHDLFGHAKEGFQFGPRGEFNAWKAHSEMFSPEAQGALAAETLAQNSWVNFGKHLRDERGNIATKGDEGFVPLTERPFAEQKNVVIPAALIDEARGSFLPTAREYEARRAAEKITPKVKKAAATPASNPTAWILPDGNLKPLTTSLHENDLSLNRESYAEQFGTNFADKPTVEDRQSALNAGFVRMRSRPDGSMTVEIGAEHLDKQRGKLLDALLANQGSIDKLRIGVLDRKGNVVDSFDDSQIFRAEDRGAAIEAGVNALRMTKRAAIGPSAITRARHFGVSGEFLPGDLLDLGLPSEEALAQKRLTSRVSEIKAKFPEAVPPQYARNEDGNYALRPDGKPRVVVQEYDLVNSPLARESAKGIRGGAEREDAITSALGKKLVSAAKVAGNNRDIKAGATWYSTARTRLKKTFGDDSKFFAELLGASSARTPVGQNYIYALDAYNQFKAGAFDSILKKYREGKNNWERGEVQDFLDDAKLEDPTRGQYLDWWIDTHNLEPRQSNGKKFGVNSRPLLRVLDGSWASEVKGPKTPNFAGNLTGQTFEATIDVWAARMLHRLANEGARERWRILPESETGVTDADFYLGQAAYRKAAEKLGMKPDALQAILWYAEKDHWEKQGWTRGAGAEKSDFNSLLADTEKGPSGQLQLRKLQTELAFAMEIGDIQKRK